MSYSRSPQTTVIVILLSPLLLFSLSTVVESSDILALFPFPARSHYAVVDRLLLELARRGHRLTVYTPFPKSNLNTTDNYVQVNVSGCIRLPTAEITPDNMLDYSGTYDGLSLLYELTPTYEDMINCEPLMRLLNSSSDSYNRKKKYDLLLTECFHTDIMLLFAHAFKIPFITMTPNVMFPWLTDRLASPDNPAYMTQFYEGYLGSRMNFHERLRNTYSYVLSGLIYRYLIKTKDDQVAGRLLGPNTPSLSELAKNTSVMFVNTNDALNSIRPLVPSVVQVGGINVDPVASPLPTDIETFINESEHGVVYFCMGSLLRGSSFPEEKRNAFLYAFSKIPQRVLWKWEGDELPGKSDKIMTSKWMPQRDILAHPKVKLFISHGGLLGTNEAVYEGVPILGIPIFGDQRTNVRSIEASGAGEMLDYNEISNEVVLEKIQRLINYPKYRENAEQLSRRYRDRPMPPLDTAVYWTEYVIRHKGAPHLRSPAVDMPWYQYLLLDVIAFVIFVLVATLVVIYYVLKFTLRILLRILFRIFTRKPNVSKTSKKVD